MLTTADLRNPSRASGYDHVNGQPQYLKNRPWRAQSGGLRKDRGSKGWFGPRRATPEQAAQDYCDYINSGGQAAHTAALKTAGHNGKRQSAPRDPEVQHALGVLRDWKGQQEGKQGYVYLIIEVNPGGGLSYGKVGYSTNPKARVAELQTGNPRPLALHALKTGTVEDEAALHRKYISNNILQEWFHITKDLLLEFPLDADGRPWGAAPSEATAKVAA